MKNRSNLKDTYIVRVFDIEEENVLRDEIIFHDFYHLGIFISNLDESFFSDNGLTILRPNDNESKLIKQIFHE